MSKSTVLPGASPRLIESHAALLEALHELLGWAHSVEGMKVSDGVVANGEIFEQARAAIEKAESL